MGLDTVELIMRVEEEFEIEIADDEAGTLETAGDICDCVARHKSAWGFDGPKGREELWPQVRRIISDELSVLEEQITPSSNIVLDLGAD
jgi:acyl carrier protein